MSGVPALRSTAPTTPADPVAAVRDRSSGLDRPAERSDSGTCSTLKETMASSVDTASKASGTASSRSPGRSSSDRAASSADGGASWGMALVESSAGRPPPAPYPSVTMTVSTDGSGRNLSLPPDTSLIPATAIRSAAAMGMAAGMRNRLALSGFEAIMRFSRSRKLSSDGASNEFL